MNEQRVEGLTVEEPAGVRAVEAGAIEGRRLRYYDYCMAAFAVLLICANLIGAGKVAALDLPLFGTVAFGAGILFFPLSYVLGDVLTEVYGYARARRVVWVGFAASVFAAGMAAVVVAMPPADDWTGQEALAGVMGQAPRIFAASVTAFWAGEFANAFVMARMKVWTRGRYLWTRTIGSTVVGQGVDSLIFYPLAFLGVWDTRLVLTVMATNYLMKVLWEALLTPVTYKVVAFMKRSEGLDVFDVETDFTPFRTKV
ncbi:queuosine precursor transporter [Sandaracinobacter sp. RS1-74]|uniref:queuosine precursor transporter n=1 Tax=Sandaracinobacteroides sayramensis TaxID=2913411 RepID=UPI001EDAEEB5|nr:queuosine precursor transporter [Sandaracinobacteroides sayramensis]MCG2840387.1 queuosine precursor transporter [Sandaracinobacteroides sayramensis]